jgi:hypothetical protein
VLPDLAAESIEAADRLVQLSAEKGLDATEAEYLLVSGLAAINRIPRLWPIVRSRIAAGTTGATAQQLLTRLLEAVERNLALAGALKAPARNYGDEAREGCQRKRPHSTVFCLRWTFETGTAIRAVDIYVDDSQGAAGLLQVPYAGLVPLPQR